MENRSLDAANAVRDLHTRLNTNWLLRFISVRSNASHYRDALARLSPLWERATLTRIRVLVAQVSGVLRDIIDTTLAAQPDMKVVTDRATPPPVHAVSVERPDVVVIGLGDSDEAEAIEELFGRYPHARVLGIASDGRRAYMHELRPHRVSLGELSPDQLVHVIRRAGRSAGGSGRSPS